MIPDAKIAEAHQMWVACGKSRKKAAKRLRITLPALQRRLEAYENGRGRVAPDSDRSHECASAGSKRIFVIPDTQVRPGEHWEHTMRWVGLAIAHYRPDVVVHIGDHWDFPSLGKYDLPGSVKREGLRYADDLKAGNDAFALMCAPMEALEASDPTFKPEKHVCFGNHENRADRAAEEDAKLFGTVGTEDCDTRDWQRHPYLERLWLQEICFAHFFANQGSGKPIGGEVSNRLNRIGASFVQGHEQGRRYGNRITGAGHVWHGFVVGSCYTHIEGYRGAQGQKHWRGIQILNEARDGECSSMDLTLDYLCRRFEGVGLHEFMVRNHPHENWEHLR